ncbi:Hypothetical predicted protein [Mytilus galloprovincialis]|uniref:Uncharacterized protein n=1 Tax=Mytilus galloprovincialis TaxID=29158 RepID=A0A8B6G9W3_MYTGA|nr:Hypothetical predicted protein [Mytilus galloprovincialis]
MVVKNEGQEIIVTSVNNLASYSLVTQIPSGSVPASLAIDGDKFSCSRTKGSSVTFQVDLMEASIVTGILLTFGEINSTEGDHAVYASNTSSGWKSGTVLYKEKTLPTEIDFFSIFRYLTYVPPGDSYTSFEICEIGVIGCPPTHYGHLCSRSCPKNCKGPCDLESGSCIFGCINGWTGNTCARECPTGQFGKNCSEFCEGCLSRMCSNVDGLCENTTACNPGYIYEEYCNKTCDMWHFGKNCTKNCYCLRGPCNVFTGDCPSGGCKNGWQGESCDEVSTKSGSVAAADNSVISTQIGLFIGGFLLGALTMLATYLLVIIKRKLRTKQGKEKETDKTQSNGQQQYDDVQMENVSSTYQDLMAHQTRPTSNDYDQINTAYVNQ